MKSKSRDILSGSIRKRCLSMMAGLLSNFEELHPETKDLPQGTKYRAFVKDRVNDVLRATLQELTDYDIEYRPLKLGNDNILSVTAEFLESVDRVDFSDAPSVKIQAAKSHAKVLDAVRSTIGAGVLYASDADSVIFEVVGVADCINYMVPIMDKYRLTPDVRTKYVKWRRNLVAAYVSGVGL